jgi:hypothetical protein
VGRRASSATRSRLAYSLPVIAQGSFLDLDFSIAEPGSDAELAFMMDLFNCVSATVQSWSLDRNLPPDLNDLIGWQAEKVADMGCVALHDSE